ncbi:MAG: sensor histidine kinase, partial [Ginsengibacter sp.]
LELIQRKDDFLSIASHELKTPVTSLKAYTQLLRQDSKESGDSKREKMLSKIEAQADKLTHLVNDLLDSSKIQNGKLVYDKHLFPLNDLVAEIVEETQNTITSHKIFLKKNAPLKVNADRERIGQVLNNLLNNVIKYCPTAENIIVSLEEKDHMAICSVEDFGDGIINDQQDKIFERFYRVTGNNLHTFPGLGLGLYIAREIVERHDGRIWVKSEPGMGSTFYFSLPIATSEN